MEGINRSDNMNFWEEWRTTVVFTEAQRTDFNRLLTYVQHKVINLRKAIAISEQKIIQYRDNYPDFLKDEGDNRWGRAKKNNENELDFLENQVIHPLSNFVHFEVVPTFQIFVKISNYIQRKLHYMRENAVRDICTEGELEEFYYTLELIISPYLPERSCIILTTVSNPTQYKNDETEHFILQICSYMTFRFHHAITLEMKNINDEKSIFVDCCDLSYDDDCFWWYDRPLEQLDQEREQIKVLLQWLEDVIDVNDEDEHQVDYYKVTRFPRDCYRRILEYFENRFQYLAQKYEYETNWGEGGDQNHQHRLRLLEKEINVTKNFIKDAEEYFEGKMREPLIVLRVYGCKNTEDQITNT